MLSQHSKESLEEIAPDEGIMVPLGLPEFRVVTHTWQTDGKVSITVIARAISAVCPHCQGCCDQIHDCRPRSKRDLPLQNHRVRVIVLKRRFRCRACRKPFTEPDETCGRRRPTTHRLREAIGTQAMSRPISHVAQAFGTGPRFVQDCLEQVACPMIEQQGSSLDDRCPLPTPRFLGIDECARRKGQIYDTILCDLEHRRVLDVSAGRTQPEVIALLKRLGNPDGVQAVSMDMSGSFRAAVRCALPHAQIVVDPFHVIQRVTQAFRHDLSHWANGKEGHLLFFRKQYLFLKAHEDLTLAQQQERLRIGKRLPLLETSWHLREDLRTWYATATAETACADLDGWIAKIQEQGSAALRQSLPLFQQWRSEILAFFAFLPLRISNGFVEGKNHRTKALMRQAYGYRNRQHLRLRILLGTFSAEQAHPPP